MNTIKALISSSLITASVVLAPTSVLADVPVNPVDYTGSRSVSGNGVFGTASWNTSDFTISWDITPNVGFFHYTYSISGSNGSNLRKELSHFILEISTNITSQNFDDLIYNISVTGADIDEISEPRVFSPSDPGKSNPGLPADIYGFKIDFDDDDQTFPLTIEFDSVRTPVWGDFYTKSGKERVNGKKVDVYAYNAGLGTDPDLFTTDFNNWIPTPDTNDVPFPEPSTYLLLTTFLLMIGLAKYRKKSIA